MKTILKAVCDQAFLSDSKNLNIIGIFDNITSSEFPATHLKMAFVFTLEGEAGEIFSYFFDIADKDGKKIFENSAQPAQSQIGTNGRINLIINLNLLQFPREGVYRATFHLGNLEEVIDINVLPLNR